MCKYDEIFFYFKIEIYILEYSNLIQEGYGVSYRDY